MPGPTPDPEVVARAWLMFDDEGKSYREIGRLLGISATTASKYVGLGRHASMSIAAFDKARAQARMLHFLSEFAEHGMGLVRRVGEPREGETQDTADDRAVDAWQKVGPVVLKAAQQFAEVGGLNRPVSAPDDGGNVLPDEEIAAAIVAARATNALEAGS